MATKKTGGVKAPREVEKKTPEQVVEKEAAERPQYKVPFITARIDRLSDNPDSKIRANVSVTIGNHFAVHGFRKQPLARHAHFRQRTLINCRRARLPPSKVTTSDTNKSATGPIQLFFHLRRTLSNGNGSLPSKKRVGHTGAFKKGIYF